MNTDKIYAEMLAAEYAPKTERRVIALRKLDRYAKRPAVIFVYVLGELMILHLGAGMFLISKNFLFGIALAIVGILGMALNYPLYEILLNKAKRRYAFEIVELAKDICEYNN